MDNANAAQTPAPEVTGQPVGGQQPAANVQELEQLRREASEYREQAQRNQERVKGFEREFAAVRDAGFSNVGEAVENARLAKQLRDRGIDPSRLFTPDEQAKKEPKAFDPDEFRKSIVQEVESQMTVRQLSQQNTSVRDKGMARIAELAKEAAAGDETLEKLYRSALTHEFVNTAADFDSGHPLHGKDFNYVGSIDKVEEWFSQARKVSKAGAKADMAKRLAAPMAPSAAAPQSGTGAPERNTSAGPFQPTAKATGDAIMARIAELNR